MLTINNLNIIQSVDELPECGKTIYMDAETNGLKPYEGDKACGWAVTWDDNPKAYYIPIRHTCPGAMNLPLAQVNEWLQHTVNSAEVWVNHNIKFDAHFLNVDGVYADCDWIDTVLPAKMIDSDRMNHRLKDLCRDWCGMDMGEELEVKAYLKGIKSKDYSRVPIDMLGRYACMDTIGNRTLWLWEKKHLPEGQRELWEREFKLTKVLFKMEARGLRIDKERTLFEKRKTLQSLIQTVDRVDELTGVELIDSSASCFDILCNSLGLPVLKYTPKGGPSFDKDAMTLYCGHPEVVTNPVKKEVVELIMKFRNEGRYLGLYLNPFLEHKDRIHSSYNQIIRTGRMSCSNPNAQQFDSRAADLIVPDEGKTLICGDASQLEFRLIVHYALILGAIKEYSENPNTDYHSFVADICKVQRSPGKTINFAVAYGAGEKTVMRELMNNKEVMAEVYVEGIDVHQYQEACALRAKHIYETYHENFPEIRRTAEKARSLCGRRGFIKNFYGRRRHLPKRMSHKAFNSLIQGCAMDVIKERMVYLETNPWYKENEVELLANKHDELLFQCPNDIVEEAMSKLKLDLEDNNDFRVPFVWDLGKGKTWNEAK